MTESRYLQVFADSSDALLLFLGIDEAYHRRRGSYFTVETHIMHLNEVKALEPVHTTTQILSADDKRLHVFQTMHHATSGEVLATAEQMLLHVDAKTKRAAPAEPGVLARLHDLAAKHAALARPPTAGRAVGQKR
jgi:carnitine 3-dehydrogenase